jgi:hypothetical protein
MHKGPHDCPTAPLVLHLPSLPGILFIRRIKSPRPIFRTNVRAEPPDLRSVARWSYKIITPFANTSCDASSCRFPTHVLEEMRSQIRSLTSMRCISSSKLSALSRKVRKCGTNTYRFPGPKCLK